MINKLVIIVAVNNDFEYPFVAQGTISVMVFPFKVKLDWNFVSNKAIAKTFCS